jgi:hypothetical protein
MSSKYRVSVSVYEYKCRRCHEISTLTIEEIFSILIGKMHNLNKSDEEMANDLEEFNKTREEDEELLVERPVLFDIHICGDGGRGLSDLIGCEPARNVIISNEEWKGRYRDHAKSNFTGRQKEFPYLVV